MRSFIDIQRAAEEVLGVIELPLLLEHKTEQELRDYFVYLREEKRFARSSMTIALCGIKFFREDTSA